MKNYLIVGLNQKIDKSKKLEDVKDLFVRSIVYVKSSKLDAIKQFNLYYPEMLIISISELNKNEVKWFLENNMPGYESLPYYGE